MPEMQPTGLNRFVQEVLSRARESGMAMPLPKLPEKEAVQQEQVRGEAKVPWTARIPAFVREVMGHVVTGPEIYPERGYPGHPQTPPTEALEPAQSLTGLEAGIVVKHEVGTLLADAGVKLQRGFFDALEGVKVTPGLYGRGGYTSTLGIGTPPFQVEKVGYPGPEYATHPREVGWVFLHEALHRLDEQLIWNSPDEREDIWEALLEHYDKADPQSAKWLRWTAEGKNPIRAIPEAFDDALMHYLFYHRDVESGKLDKLLKDYFTFE